MLITLIAWGVLGIIAGFVSSKVIDTAGTGVFLDMLLGVAGALVGGMCSNLLGRNAITSLGIWSLFASIVGAVVLVGLYRLAHAYRYGTA